MNEVIVPVLLSFLLVLSIIQASRVKRMLFQAYAAPTIIFYLIGSLIPISYFITAFLVDFITIYILLVLPKSGIFRLLLMTVCFISMLANFYGLINLGTVNEGFAKVVYESVFLGIYGMALLIMLTGAYRDRAINYHWTGLFSDRRNVNNQG